MLYLAGQWRLTAAQTGQVISKLRSLAGFPAVFGSGAAPRLVAVEDPSARTRFPHTAVLFAAALSNGWPWSLALRIFAGVSFGSFCNRGCGFITSYGMGLSTERLQTGRWLVGHVSESGGGDLSVSVFFDDSAAVLFVCNKSLRVVSPEPPRGRSGAGPRRRTRFLPEYVRLPTDSDGNPVLPRFLVTSIVERRHVWVRLIQMDGVTRSLVNGKPTYPRVSGRVTASWLRNHRSWEDPEVKAVLGKKLATWFYQGALEYVPPGVPPPTVIEPKAVVAKKGKDKYRDITDAREGNKSLEPWGVIYFTARDLADALMPCAIVSGHDMQDGYHISLFSGCTGELVWGWGVIGFYYVYPSEQGYSESESDGEELRDADPEPSTASGVRSDRRASASTASGVCTDRAGSPGEDHGSGSEHGRSADSSGGPSPARKPQLRFRFGWRLHVGCWPGSCCRTCDKAYNGMEFDGCIARWAVAHFGQAVAGSPLNCIAMCLLRHMAMRNPAPGERRGTSSRTGNGVVWVDDFVFYKLVQPHAACSGLAGGCPACCACLPQAEEVDEYWVELCGRLGVPLNLDKRQRCGQTVEYAGFLYDTLRGLLLILPDKLVKLLGCLQEWAESDTVTARGMDAVRGRVLHYSACISHTRVLATEILCLVGAVEESQYDTPFPVTAAMVDLAAELRSVITKYHGAGRPLWPLVPSSGYRVFLEGGMPDAVAFALTWDASTRGWAALLRWWETVRGRRELCEHLFIGTWPAGSAVGEQAHRELLAAPLALEAALQLRHPRLDGRLGFFRNDAEAAISALRKGSSSSPPMQAGSLKFARLCAGAGVDPLCMHVPGLALVAEGIDGASRSGTTFGKDANLDSVVGPSVSDSLWAKIAGAAQRCGLRVTVDLFATESNRRAERYCSRYGEPGSEAVDALMVSDWGQSRCPCCGAVHREVAYAFPPCGLIKPTVRKAIADAAICVLVVPVAITAPYWHKLLKASVLPVQDSPDGFVRIRNPRTALCLAGSYDPKELAVFVCDFSRLTTRADLAAPSGCAGSFAARRRPLCGSSVDYEDRCKLREALLAAR